ncbi:hypothetical protein BN1708_009482 [Verticillium longisporum]|uniref:Pre-rRNA-processing protein RIX1 n=1 Tax=Verticillium longisporum TaxID=100787 RepID=A0A0G4KHR7_VERLO|nr:hypothetical protein BN1708_009482 [Verticillium longisporum]
MSLPPDLRVLCRRLTSTPPAQLPHSIPAFTGHVLRCRDVLSTPHDPKSKDGANEAYMLVHKLKTIITTLLNGKSAAGRFTGVTLVKAVVDVGGWECLRESGPWVRSLLSILQKNDPFAVKELCVVALIKIYTLVNGFQTLTREIATPTIATFFNACLQLVKQPPAGERLKTPLHLVETILDAFATLQPLYPATCRPFNKDIRVVIKPYLAPTWHVFDRGNERRAHIVSASSSRTRCPLANVGISAPLEQELDHLSVSLLAGHVQGCFTLAVNHVQYIRTLVEEKSGHLHAPFSSLASVERTHAVTVSIIDVGTVLEKYLD